MKELRNLEEWKNVYIPNMEDNYSFARDLQRRLSDIPVKVDLSISGLVTLRNYDNPIIQIMSFDTKDVMQDENQSFLISVFDIIFELDKVDGKDYYELTNVYKKLKVRNDDNGN